MFTTPPFTTLPSAGPDRSLPQELSALLKEHSLWRGCEQTQLSPSPHLAISTGLPAIDSAIGGLTRAALHEFSLHDSFLSQGERRRWHTPFLFLSPILAQVIATSPLPIFWIGRRCWPTPFVTRFIEQLRTLSSSPITSESSILSRSLLVDPEDRKKRLWSILEALKHSAAVIADGSRFSFQESRRLQLRAAESRSILLLIRPPWEGSLQSSAHTRWQIRPHLGEDLAWKITLTKARGLAGPISWIIKQCESADGTPNYRCLLSDAQCGSDSAELPAENTTELRVVTHGDR